MDIGVASTFLLLGVMLLWIFACPVIAWTYIFSSLGTILRSGLEWAGSYDESVFDILRHGQTVFQNDDTLHKPISYLDLAVHVLSIPEPSIFTASRLIRQMRPRWGVRSKKPRSLPVTAATQGPGSDPVSGASVLSKVTEHPGLRGRLGTDGVV